jgi:hypothetical protein
VAGHSEESKIGRERRLVAVGVQALRTQQDLSRRGGRPTQSVARKLYLARPAEAKAVALADDIALLKSWLHYDIFAVSGMPTRSAASCSISSAPN